MAELLTVRIRFKGDYNLEKLIKKTEELDGRRIIVAPHGARNEMLAAIHEYGIQIRVTDRMRGYLASQGLYLKKSTSFINIPERSFIRNGWDIHEFDVIDMLKDYIPMFVGGSISAEDLLEDLGAEAAELIQQYAEDLDNPANHPFTIEQKGFNDPLIESGEMVRSIDYEIE